MAASLSPSLNELGGGGRGGGGCCGLGSSGLYQLKSAAGRETTPSSERKTCGNYIAAICDLLILI